jgi:hypothetical protein
MYFTFISFKISKITTYIQSTSKHQIHQYKFSWWKEVLCLFCSLFHWSKHEALCVPFLLCCTRCTTSSDGSIINLMILTWMISQSSGRVRRHLVNMLFSMLLGQKKWTQTRWLTNYDHKQQTWKIEMFVLRSKVYVDEVSIDGICLCWRQWNPSFAARKGVACAILFCCEVSWRYNIVAHGTFPSRARQSSRKVHQNARKMMKMKWSKPTCSKNEED